LNAGRQARLEPGAAIAVTDIAPDDAFAWQSGRLVYHNASLSQIIEDLNRYSDTPIVASPDAARLRFSGVLEIDRASSMLARLENFLPIHVEADQGRILVKGVD
jgi:transmembrane sensor